MTFRPTGVCLIRGRTSRPLFLRTLVQNPPSSFLPCVIAYLLYVIARVEAGLLTKGNSAFVPNKNPCCASKLPTRRFTRPSYVSKMLS